MKFENKFELEEYLRDKEKIGNGAEGVCYKIGDDVFKIYNYFFDKDINRLKHFDYKEFSSYYLQFKDVRVDNFNFIKDVISLNDKYVVGSICKYVSGDSLQTDTLCTVPIDKIIDCISNLLPSIWNLSRNYNISVGDIFVNNIIYDGRNFNFIDTASYFYSIDEPYYTYKNNVIEIIREIMFNITNSYNNNGLIYDFFVKNCFEYNYYFDNELLSNPIKLLKKLKSSLEEYCDREIVCFRDSEDILIKKLKRS